jgi:putative ABC transport system permease protein
MSPEELTPRWLDSLIENLAPAELAEEIQGDLFEMFVKDLEVRGVRSARRRYVVNGLGFLFKRFFWKRLSTIPSPVMIRSYFKMASRSLLAHKGTALLNVLGLVVGIAAALVILAVVRFETSFDAFHSNADRIYRVVRVSGEDMSEFRTGVSFPVPIAMKAEIASLENITSMEYFGGAFIEVPDRSGKSVNRFQEETGCVIVEPSFFSIFDFRNAGLKWVSGNPHTALKEPFSVVLTRSMAKKYFGDAEALGQTLRIARKFDFKVTGVMEDLPANTDFPFKVMISYASYASLGGTGRFEDWNSVDDSHCTYVVLPAGMKPAEMEKQIARVHAAHTSEQLHKFRHYLLQPFREQHFDARFGNFNGRTISHETIWALAIIAVFLILTASINYVNLATAQSTLRAREIGLRKVMGGNRRNLVIQFMMETFLIVLAAAFLGLLLSELLLINLQELLNLRISVFHMLDPYTLYRVAAIVFVITVLAGSYPALIVSGFNPVNALKSKFTSVRSGGVSLRKVLVVVQFTITQILVVGTFIVVSQMHFFQDQDMGFNRDAIITMRLPDRSPELLKGLEDQLRAQSFVSQVSLSYTLPSGENRNRSYRDIGKPDANSMKDYVVYEYAPIDDAYLDLYQIRLAAGRNLTMQDSFRYILINETLVKNLALGTPEEAVGKELKMDKELVTVAGVVKDFYSNSLKEGVDNVVMYIHPRNYSVISIKLNTREANGSLPEVVRRVEKIWSSTFPEYIFSYEFFDENVKSFYAQEQKYAQLFQLFSFTFLAIGCLGLYGLIAFIVNRKGKEVAIRKVMGATISNILVLFSREYVQLIAVSFVLAAPIAYYAVDSWLNQFANHIGLHWWMFILPGAAVLVIALLVVTSKSVTAAVTNPVEKLKHE